MKIKDKINMTIEGLVKNGPINIVAFGDSVTHGAVEIGKYDYEGVYWNRLRKKILAKRNVIPVNVIDAGIGGATASDSLERMDTQVFNHAPDLIIVCFGLNDVNDPLEKFLGALNGDLNTSVAVTALYDVLKAKCNDATKLAAIADFDQVLSLNLLSAAKTLREKQTQEEQASADPEIDALVAARTEAKKTKNFAEADRIRDELKARGIEIIDTPQGAKWRKV